ncbi:MAG: DUF4476 domain-containing protein [Chitinophaga sp.]|uniref:DUF4476 domain-containing protein n=1 Tax=Chitinophaga sp. TaxID=1869181 RepID=UPI001B2002BF|nr:DUF4476 domain-containing protein [Chitinophaga sp.]MBO9733034.1 DUF4476 domain-containing protein [Chitinophaga sp.]
MHLKYRTVIFVWACLLLCGRLWAQEQRHYVYIQSEKGQPFYVKHDGKVLSSTERGYIILPQLENGTVPITVGFPKNEANEAQFYLKIAKNDQGFLLKQSGENGYALYNLQTFRELKSEAGAPATAATETLVPADTLVPVLDTAKKEMMTNLQKDLETTFADKAVVTGPSKPSTPAKSSNPFSSALDKVVVTGDDRNEPEPEVKPAAPAEQPVAADTEVKKPKGKKHKGDREPLTEEEKAILSDVLAEEGKVAASEAATEDVAKAAPAEEQPVKKHKKHKAKEGDPDFIEFQDDKSQPAATGAAVAATAAPVVVEVPVTTPEEAPVRKKKKRSKLFDDTENPPNIITDSSGYGVAATRPVTDEEPVKSKKKKKHNDAEVAVDAAGAPVGAAVGAEVTPDVPVTKKKGDTRLINSDCANVMDDATFRKVLRKVVAARTDNSMIDVFQRQTRNYCLETAQIKTLAQLLTADDTRYRLLDAAYSKTYDTEKYGSLETLLIDDYYRGRFRAMLHK